MFLSFVNHVVALCVLIICCVFLFGVVVSIYRFIVESIEGRRMMKYWRKKFDDIKE